MQRSETKPESYDLGLFVVLTLHGNVTSDARLVKWEISVSLSQYFHNFWGHQHLMLNFGQLTSKWKNTNTNLSLCVQMSEVQKPSLKTAKKIFLHFTKKCNKTKQVNLPSFVSGEIRSSGFSSKDLRVIPGRDCRADAIFSGEASCVLLGERSVRVYQLTWLRCVHVLRPPVDHLWLRSF